MIVMFQMTVGKVLPYPEAGAAEAAQPVLQRPPPGAGRGGESAVQLLVRNVTAKLTDDVGHVLVSASV